MKKNIPWLSLTFEHIQKQKFTFRHAKYKSSEYTYLYRHYSVTENTYKVLPTDVVKNDCYLKNVNYAKKLSEKYLEMAAIAMAGGGEKAIQRHVHNQKKMMVLDRVQTLLDDPDSFLELSLTAGLGMEYGNVPRAGMMTVIGRVKGKLCMIIANDATVKGGTIYPISLKKQLRAQEIAEQNRLPTIYVVESGGAFLPLQSEIFPDKNQGGRSFYNEAVMSAHGIPQVAIVCGSCTAGGAYVPTMADETVIIDKKGTIFLGGPPLVQAATGEIISSEDLGGAKLHCETSGCTDYFAESEKDGIITGRDIISTLNVEMHLHPLLHQDPLFSTEDLASLASHDNEIDIKKVIAGIVDGSRFHEYKARWGKSLVTGFSFIHGYLVGIVGNQGEITEYAADKGANFIQICDERDIPIIFLQNTSASTALNLPGETDGNKLRGHAKMMSAVSTCRVPKITFVVGDAIGCDSYLMGGRCTGPNFVFNWPNARFAIQSPSVLIEDILQSNEKALSETEAEAYKAKIQEKYLKESSGFYAASRLWTDGIVLPQETRKVAHQCLEIVLAYRKPVDVKTAVIRM